MIQYCYFLLLLEIPSILSSSIGGLDLSDMRILRGFILLRVGQRQRYGQEFSYIYILNIYEYIAAATHLHQSLSQE